jgi:hypothetical protein
LNGGAKPIFDRNVLGIYATAIEARLMTGHIAGATTALRQVQRQYGKSSELSTVTALIDHIHGNDNAAVAVLDIGFYSLPVEAASKSDVLVATKAGFLAKSGETHKARSLIAANIDKVHSERIKAGQYKDACRVYFSMRINAIGDKALVHRNLASAALKGAREAEAAGRKQEAGMFWRYLLVANPESSTARQGVMRCAVAN